jgi:hypothetical protein
MSKVIFWAIVFFVLWRFLRHAALQQRQREAAKDTVRPEERMVACHCCHLYFPEKESLVVNGLFYCSPACSQQAGRGDARTGQC